MMNLIAYIIPRVLVELETVEELDINSVSPERIRQLVKDAVYTEGMTNLGEIKDYIINRLTN